MRWRGEAHGGLLWQLSERGEVPWLAGLRELPWLAELHRLSGIDPHGRSGVAGIRGHVHAQ